MNTSTEINKLAEGLAAAQAEFKPIVKNKINPHFKSHYADLSSINDGTREALCKHGLSIIQGNKAADSRVIIVTRLLHKSGQWIETELSIKPAQDNPQQIGSAITYGRRYAHSAILAVAADEDDDGHAATAPNKPAVKQKRETYEATEGQKVWFAGLCKKHGLEDRELMGNCSRDLIGKPLDEIEHLLITRIG